jgi:uncharacterized membrane protein
VFKKYLFPRLAILWAGYSLVCLVVFFATGHWVHLALIWNVFLAGLPLIFIEILEREFGGFWPTRKNRNWKKTVLWALLWILWLLFLPNAFYLVTDFIHLTDIDFYEVSSYYANARTLLGVQYVFDAKVWAELFNVAAGFLFGTGLGLVALYKAFAIWREKISGKAAWAITAGVATLSGVAIFIGRFLRFNSWDIWRPWKVVESLISSFDWFAAMFVLMAALYILFIFGLFFAVCRFARKGREKL